MNGWTLLVVREDFVLLLILVFRWVVTFHLYLFGSLWWNDFSINFITGSMLIYREGGDIRLFKLLFLASLLITCHCFVLPPLLLVALISWRVISFGKVLEVMVACTMLIGPFRSSLNYRVAWGLVTLNVVILLFLQNGRGVSLLNLMPYGESLLWRSIIRLIVYGLPLPPVGLRRFLGDPFANTWIWLWIGSPVAWVMVVLHLFSMIMA